MTQNINYFRNKFAEYRDFEKRLDYIVVILLIFLGIFLLLRYWGIA
jgi:hypothetical protein